MSSTCSRRESRIWFETSEARIMEKQAQVLVSKYKSIKEA